jgi:hypothetical protein
LKGIIILEGADGTGKTTLARALVKRYDAFYIHNGLWPDIWKRHLATVDLAIKRSQKQLVIIDRLWLSEQIYGDTFRDGPAYDLGARCLDRALLRYGAVTVLCVRRDFAGHMKHFEELKRTRVEKFARMEMVAQRYLDLASGNLAADGKWYYNQLTQFQDYPLRDDVLVYDFEIAGISAKLLDIAMDTIVGRVYALRRHAGETFATDLPNLTGNPRDPRYLFVGEQLSPRACNRAAPFLWNDEMSSATYFNKQLHKLKFREDQALWTNAIGHDWLRFLRDHLSATTRVIALGGIAARRVEELSFPNAASIPHPQWARRFQAQHPEKYRTLLQEALKI